jgi:NitT/TauT family transport system ATP-binding protein
MIFQNFALMPWLNVLQNVELGLEALGIPQKDRRKRALKTIDMIGLDGFESAFPKELSGGMQQRVGIARALVVEPDVLLMDEPFSALDVLTAENLRNDLLDLWHSDKDRKNSILLVTHNIEEAIYLADRVIILGSSPSIILGILKVNLPHPRTVESVEFQQLVNDVYTMMTSLQGGGEGGGGLIDLGYRFPDASISALAGLLETIDELQAADQPVDLPLIANELNLNIDDLFSLTDVLNVLHFVEEAQGNVKLTSSGKLFVEADILERKKIFSKHLLMYVPLIKHIYKVLNAQTTQRMHKNYFLDDLKPYLSDNDANRVLKVVIEWGRYAELFAYDAKSNELNLENPE